MSETSRIRPPAGIEAYEGPNDVVTGPRVR